MSWCQGLSARLAAVFSGIAITCLVASAQGSFGGVGMQPSVVERAKIDPPDSETAKGILAILDKAVELGTIECKIGALDEALTTKLDGIPFFIDPRGLKMAEISSDQMIKAELKPLPLRSALRELLQSHGLKAVVQNEGVLITADFLELTRRGIATSRWIHLDQDFSDRVEKALAAPFTAEFLEFPLNETIAQIADSTKLPIVVDQRALEEIGLSSDQPVSLRLKDVPLRTVMNTMLRQLDLTYTTFDNVITVTTIEAAEQQCQNRIYWLEGIGMVRGDMQSLMDAIQTTIVPDTWEALGGPSTMCPITLGDGNRPAILISTIYPIHHDIEQLIKSLRDAHVGVDPTGTIPSKPAPNSPLNVVGQGGAF